MSEEKKGLFSDMTGVGANLIQVCSLRGVEDAVQLKGKISYSLY